MKKVFCVLRYIFIPILCILVMSHNAGALNLEYSVASYWAGAEPYSTLWGSNDGNNGNSYICAGGTDYRTTISRLLVFFDNNMASSVRAGDIFELNLSGTSDGNNNVNLDFAINLYDDYGNFDVIDVNYSSAGLSAAKFQIILMAKKNNVTSVDLRRIGGFPFTSMSKSGGGLECLATGNWTAYHPVGNGSQAIVDAINNSSDAGAINSAKDAIVDAINEQNQKEEEAVQDAADDSSTAGQDSSDDAASATTGLISAIGGFVSAITNASPSNCNINANLNHINLGVLDLCSMPVPSYVSIIGSIIAIMLVVPFCIVMFNRFIGLFRSFQG